jgi:hypothetical protein
MPMMKKTPERTSVKEVGAYKKKEMAFTISQVVWV